MANSEWVPITTKPIHQYGLAILLTMGCKVYTTRYRNADELHAHKYDGVTHFMEVSTQDNVETTTEVGAQSHG